jgi:hypothetical protein
MNPRVKTVNALEDYRLSVVFDNNEKGVFDTKPYLNFPVFSVLKDVAFFKQVKASLGFVSWNGEVDFDPDTVYLESIKE